MGIESKSLDSRITLSSINSADLTEMLPGWKIEEKVFVREYKGGELIGQESGWVIKSPDERYLFQVEKDAKRVRVLHRGEYLMVTGITELMSDRLGNNLSFRGKNIRLLVEFSQSPSKATEVQLEVTPKGTKAISLLWKLD